MRVKMTLEEMQHVQLLPAQARFNPRVLQPAHTVMAAGRAVGRDPPD
jgi:hypothetical protein